MIPINKTEKKIGKSGYKGVHMVRHNVYQAVITMRITGKSYTKVVGSFTTPEEAYVARVNYIKKLL